ncbi:hypothetical protein KGM_207245 [Danaus plexippus plexippus]|uniref:Uncharacterized protein n=1 Tax=Danaus plexippus plexippus TaxID=278856 RepID=A0A212ES09_DANPL|nr:hypothetical protein KGM_207245 [Danaus plexippus plexippus]
MAAVSAAMFRPGGALDPPSYGQRDCKQAGSLHGMH